MISVEAILTCSEDTTFPFSLVAAMRAPLARLLARRSSPPEALVDGQDGLIGKKLFVIYEKWTE